MNVELVRQQLERITASQRFLNAEKQKTFLRYIVEAALRGESGELKETVIGVKVFGRRPDYDPRSDATVRVEAGKLRTRLAEYFAAEGVSDPLVISIPKGSYRPVFTQVDLPPRPGWSGKSWKLVALFCCGVFVLVLAALASRAQRLAAPSSSQFIHLMVCDGGSIFAVRSDGDLFLYRHRWHEKLKEMDNGGLPLKVGNGWDRMRETGCMAGGQILARDPAGRLLWYKTALPDGPAIWDIRSGTQVDAGWGDVDRFALGPDGSIFARQSSGRLRFHRFAEFNGVLGWPIRDIDLPGDWSRCRALANAGDGVIYCLDRAGSLEWHRMRMTGGKAEWAPASGATIARGWNGVISILAASEGVLYAVTCSGALHWYKRLATDPASLWEERSGEQVGLGFVLSE